MKIGIRLAAVILGGFGSAAAAAAPIRYDCDTAAGSFSEIEQGQKGPAYAVAGTVEPVQLRTHEQWLPAAARVDSNDGKRSVALQLVPEVRGGSTFAIVAVSADDDKKGRTRLGKIALGETLAFSIRAVGGSVRVEAAGKVATMPVAIGGGGRVGVSCSTGQFKFETLDLEAAAE